MLDKKISEMELVSLLQDIDYIPIVQNEVNKRVTINKLAKNITIINDNTTANPFILEGKAPGIYIFTTSVAETAYATTVYVKATNAHTANLSLSSIVNGMLFITKEWTTALETNVRVFMYIGTAGVMPYGYTSTSTSGLTLNSTSTVIGVTTSTTQTISGVKTFSGRPLISASAVATDDNHILKKSEIDARIPETVKIVTKAIADPDPEPIAGITQIVFEF